MLTITIDRDYFAYLDVTDNDITLFSLLKRSFSRKERVYNNYYKFYEEVNRRFFSLINNGKTIKVKAGLIPYLCKSLDKNNIEYKIIDKRKTTSVDIIINNNYYLNDSIKLRDYQVTAVNSVFKHRFCYVQLPTGTGKTEIAATVLKEYFNVFKNTAAIYVVPTDKLRREAEERFLNYGINVNTALPIKGNCVNIFTYMGLVTFSTEKLDYKQRDLVSLCVFDEAHHLQADKSSRIVHKFKYLNMCVGFSATPSNEVKEKTYLKDLLIKDFNIVGCTGVCAYRKEIIDTIEEKFVTKIEVRVLQNNVQQEDYRKVLGFETDWHVIKNAILKSRNRAIVVANYVKHIMTDANLTTVSLLIPEVEWSHIYMNEIAKIYINNPEVHIYELYGGNRISEYKFINSELKLVPISKQEDKQIAMSNIKDVNIKTIFSATSFFFEGIDIPCLQAIVNCYGGRDTKRIKQQCGRCMRLFDNKPIAYIHEIKDTGPCCEVLLSQFRKRMLIYEKEYEAKIIYSSFK